MLVIDMSALQMWLAVLMGWLDRQEREALSYLITENRILRAQLDGRRLRCGRFGWDAGRYGSEPSAVVVRQA